MLRYIGCGGIKVVCIAILAVAVLECCTTARADIFRWDNGQVIPGSEGIVPGPGVRLGSWNTESQNLRFADFVGLDLSKAFFYLSWLENARFTNANLTNANLYATALANADFKGAVVAGTNLQAVTSRGYTKEQLYSTASYQNQRMVGIWLSNNDLTGWNFRSQNLSNALIRSATLIDADFTGANLTGAGLSLSVLSHANLANADLTGATFSQSTLANANLSGAIINNAQFVDTASRGFTKEQLYSTASYQARNLAGLNLGYNDLSGWDFSDQNLADADFYSSFHDIGANLKNANLSRARLRGTRFWHTALDGADFSGSMVNGTNFARSTDWGLVPEQLYSTASYQSKDLRDIIMSENNLTGWNFSGQNLSNSRFRSTVLTDANLSSANLTGADFSSTVMENANLAGANLTGANFGHSDLSGADLSAAKFDSADFSYADLSGAKLAGANLVRGRLAFAVLTDADFTDAILREAGLAFSTDYGFTSAQLYSTASYQNKDLRGIQLYGNQMVDWDFRGQNLAGARLSGSDLARAKLSSAKLSGADLSRSGFSQADLSGADLTSADLTETRLENAVFTGAFINDADFTGSDLKAEQLYSTASFRSKDLKGVRLHKELAGWRFDGQDMIQADLRMANLTSAFFRSATLAYADLHGAKVENADFTSANLSHANLTNITTAGATLHGADLSFSDMRGSFAFDLAQAANLRNTILPDGRIANLDLRPDETLVANPGGPIPIKVSALPFSFGSATFDLTDNPAIVEQEGVQAVRRQLINGRENEGLGGRWTGRGLTSSTVAAANEAAPDSLSVGYAENRSLPLGPYLSFRGAAVEPEDILVTYTRTGDANLDGVVNDDDVTIVNAAYAPGVANPHWAFGNFDYDDFVDHDDVTLLNAFYDPGALPIWLISGTQGIAAVPEPSAALLTVVGIGLVIACAVRRRR